MKDCNPMSTQAKFGFKLSRDHEGKMVDNILFKQIFGSLMYLTTIRPDIMQSMTPISRYMKNPTEMHLAIAKRIF